MKLFAVSIACCFVLLIQSPLNANAAEERTVILVNLETLRDDFLKVAALAKVKITAEDIEFKYLPAPHQAPNLPKGKMAVYIFYNDKEVLKVGKVGEKSNQRFHYHHYHPKSSNSNLAQSILKDKSFKADITLNESNISDWMKKNLSRGHFLIDKKLGSLTLNLLEAFIQSRLNPKYEGSQSQKRNKG